MYVGGIVQVTDKTNGNVRVGKVRDLPQRETKVSSELPLVVNLLVSDAGVHSLICLYEDQVDDFEFTLMPIDLFKGRSFSYE